MYPSASGSLQLQFMSKLSLPIFTGSKIEGEDCNVVNIALVDGLTGQVVMSGPESSLKVEIVVLEGDFEGDEEDNWTYEDFRNNIVREREGKRSLLTGDVYLELTEGIGVLGELSFTDNSSWTRSRKFRLGASIVDGCYNGTRIKEAKTEPFMVKDHRGECECFKFVSRSFLQFLIAKYMHIKRKFAHTVSCHHSTWFYLFIIVYETICTFDNESF